MIPYILAAVGGYLIGDSLKGKQYDDGGETDGYIGYNMSKPYDLWKIVAYANGDYDKKLKEFYSLESVKKFAKENKSKYQSITFEDEYGDNIVVVKNDTADDIEWLFSEEMYPNGYPSAPNEMANGGYMEGGGKAETEKEMYEKEILDFVKAKGEHRIYYNKLAKNYLVKHKNKVAIAFESIKEAEEFIDKEKSEK